MLSIFPLYRASGINFTPVEDESRFQISVRLPVGSSIAATQSLVDRISRDVLKNLPGVLAVQGNAGLTGGGQGGNNSGSVFVRLKPIAERDVSQQELMLQARKLVQPYRKAAVISVQGTGGLSFAGGRGAQIQYALVGPDLAKLDQYTAKGMALMEKSPVLVDVDRAFQPGLPELRLDIDRQRAADLGVRIQDVSQTVNALIAGQDVTTFNAASDQYEVVLKAQDSFRRTPESIASATVRTASGELVQLRNLVTFNEGSGPAQIERLNRQRQITISANPTPGISQAEGQVALEAAFASLDMEPGYNLVTSGQSRELGRAAYYFAIAFALSFVFMYMVLAAQFESFIHPITILLTLPSGGALRAGGLAGLRPAAQYLLGARRPAALRHRQEERDPADRSHDRPARERTAALRGHHSSEPRPPAADPDDHPGAGGRHDAALPRLRSWRRNESLDRHPRRRRPVVLSRPDAPRRAGLLLALRRCGAVAGMGAHRPPLGAGDGIWPARDRTPDRPAARAGAGSRSMRWRWNTLPAIALVALSTAGAPLLAQTQAQPTPVAPPLAPRIGVADTPLPITLADAVRMTLEQNNDVSIAKLDVDDARQGVRAAEGVYDPRVTPNFGYQRDVSANTSAIGGATEGRLERTEIDGGAGMIGRTPWAGGRFTIDFSASRLDTSNQFARLNPEFPSALTGTYVQPLLRGRSIDLERRNILLARRAVDLTDAQLSQVIMDQLTLVEEAYWDLAFAARNLDVLNNALGQARAQVESNGRQVTQGTLAPIDVVEAQTQVSRFEQAVASGQQALTSAENRLKRLILANRTAQAWNQPLVPADLAERSAPTIVLDEAVKLALAKRPELKALDITRSQNEIDRAYFQNQTKPQLNVVGGYTLSGLSGDPLDEHDRAAGRQQLRQRALRASERALAHRQARPDRPAHVIGHGRRPGFLRRRPEPVTRQPVRAPLSDRARTAADGFAAAQPDGAGESGALGNRRDTARTAAPAARAGD